MTIDNKNEQQQPDEPIRDTAAAATSDDDEKDQPPNNGKEITEKVSPVKHYRVSTIFYRKCHHNQITI